MNHAELQAEVARRCTARRLRWYTWPSSMRTNPGWVDMVILGPAGAIFAEFKAEDGRRTIAQIRVAERLLAAGFTYRLWRPSDLDVIDAELDRLLLPCPALWAKSPAGPRTGRALAHHEEGTMQPRAGLKSPLLN